MLTLKKTVVPQSIWTAGISLASAVVLTATLSASAHAQASTLANDTTAPGVSTSATSSDAAVPANPTPAPAQQTANQTSRGWGISYRQDPVQGGGYLRTHGFDIAGMATGRYQTSVTHQSPNLAGTTNGVGFLGSVREHPVSWFGLELNYGYNRYTEHYRVTPAGGPVNYVQLQQNEATAGYVFHIKTPYVQPFVVLGGGGVNFSPILATTVLPSQWRGAAMYDVGLDFVPKRQPHVGFRIQEHGLFYKAPDFYVANYRSNSWVHQALPAAGVFYRF